LQRRLAWRRLLREFLNCGFNLVEGDSKRGREEMDPTLTKRTTVEKEESCFHRGWQEWLADNMMKGVSEPKIVEVLERNGFSKEFSQLKIREIQSTPTFAAGRKIFSAKIKQDKLFESLGNQYRQSGYANRVKRANVSSFEFYSDYYYCNRPIVLKGLMKKWKALKLWSPDYFAERFGDCQVEITSDRNSDARYEDNFPKHRASLRMMDFVRMVKKGGETNEFYLVAKNYVLSRPEFKVLFDHFSCPKGFLDPGLLSDGVKLWFGPKGTITPLHHDACNILFAQIYGKKRVKLVSPFDLNHVYNDRECYSAVDLENIDFDRFLLMKRVSIMDVVLSPGEAILLPLGWWHWIKSLDISISLSFSNFFDPVIWGYRRY
jgi:hypothetical protein